MSGSIGNISSDVLRYTNGYLKKQVALGVKKLDENERVSILDMLFFLHNISNDLDFSSYVEVKGYSGTVLREKFLGGYDFDLDDTVLEELFDSAMEMVFEGSDFYNEYSEKNSIGVLEKNISVITDEYRRVLVIGGSGSGKTTLLKNLIDFTDDNTLAVTSGNTTVGSTKIISKKDAKEFKLSVAFKSRAVIKEKVWEYIPVILNYAGKMSSDGDIDIEGVKKQFYDIITTSNDSKWKIGNFIKIDDISDLFIYDVLFIARKCESLFYTKKVLDRNLKKYNYAALVQKEPSYEKLFFEFVEEGRDDINKKLAASKDEYLDFIKDSIGDRSISQVVEKELSGKKNLSISRLSSNLYKIINTKINNILSDIIDIYNNDDVHEKGMEFVFDRKVIATSYYKGDGYFDEKITTKITKSNSINAINFYIDNSNVDSESIKIFKSILSRFSSVNEGDSLFPIIDEIRIFGDFTPSYLDGEDIDLSTGILFEDSEGVGHDISDYESFSMELQEKLAMASKIIVTYNVSTAESKENFISVMRRIINLGCLYKTSVCFTKTDDVSTEKGIDREKGLKKVIKAYLTNCFERIQSELDDDITNSCKFMDPYTTTLKILNEKSFVIGSLTSMEDAMLKMNDGDIDIDEDDYEFFERKILKARKKNAYPKLIEIYKWTYKKEYSFDEVLEYVKQAKISINVNELSIASYKGQNMFLELFLRSMDSEPWQTIKAFNSRMINSSGCREWRSLRPEATSSSTLMGLFRTYVVSRIIPLIQLELREVATNYFDKLIDQMSFKIRDGLKEAIYEELFDTCWLVGYRCAGTGSTYSRYAVITREMKKKFLIENIISKDNASFYKVLIKAISKSEEFKELNIKFNYMS